MDHCSCGSAVRALLIFLALRLKRLKKRVDKPALLRSKEWAARTCLRPRTSSASLHHPADAKFCIQCLSNLRLCAETNFANRMRL